MANYATLKAAVAGVVKTNGAKAITGANLQTVLLSIINSIGGGGYIFKGVATPSTSVGTPDENVFYIGGAGTYANFGTSVTVNVGRICVFKYNGSWVKEQIDLFAGIDDEPLSNSTLPVRSFGIAQAVNKVALDHPINKYWQRTYLPWWGDTTQSKVVSDVFGYEREVCRAVLTANTNYNTFGFEIYARNADGSGYYDLDAYIYSPADAGLVHFDTYLKEMTGELLNQYVTIKQGVNAIKFKLRLEIPDSFTNITRIQIYCKALHGQTILSYYNYYKNDNLNISFLNFFGNRLSVLDPTNDKDFASCAAIGNYVSGITGSLNRYVQYTDDILFRKEGVSQKISCDADGEFIGEVTSSEVASTRQVNGFFVPITYSALDFTNSTIDVKFELVDYLNISQLTSHGFVGITSGNDSWHPTWHPVQVNLSQLTNGFNIFDAVKNFGNEDYTEYYRNANLCYVVFAGYVPVGDKLPYKVGLKAYVKKSLSGVVDIDEFNGLESRVEHLEDEVGNTSNVVCWGDSLTAGAGSGNTTNASTVKAVIEAKGYTLSSTTYNYVTMLQTLLGSEYTVYNKGVGGENINAIAARQGGNNALLSGSVQLPANTSAVNINIPVSSYDRTSQVKVLLQGGQDSVNTCYVQGIPCTLSVTYDSGFTNIQYKLNRVQSGDRAVTLPKYTPIVMAGSALNPITAMAVIWCWQNGGYNSDSELVDRLKNIISHLNTTKYILIGLHSGTESSRNAQEALLEKTFGDKFFNWRQYASTNALYDFNITPTSADTTAMQSGSMPPSLLSDAVHLNSAGYMILGWKLFERMRNIGYIR